MLIQIEDEDDFPTNVSDMFTEESVAEFAVSSIIPDMFMEERVADVADLSSILSDLFLEESVAEDHEIQNVDVSKCCLLI
jgi:hypothetical protein